MKGADSGPYDRVATDQTTDPKSQRDTQRRFDIRRAKQALLAVVALAALLACSVRSRAATGARSAALGAEAFYSFNVTCRGDRLPCREDWPAREHRQFLPIEENDRFLPVFSSHDLAGNETVTEAFVTVPGLGQNAWDYYNLGAGADLAPTTLALSMWFGRREMRGDEWNSEGLGAQNRSIYWTSNLWMIGGASASSSGSTRVSSFALLDLVVKHLQARELFPNLRRIMLVGMSAGCQMLSRWAFFSSASLPVRTKASVSVVAAACSSYMYLDSSRPSPSCRPLADTGIEHWCTSFEQPDRAPSNFNDYKYGLGRLSHLRFTKHFDNSQAIRELIHAFPKKDLWFMIGTEDTCLCSVGEHKNPLHCYHRGWNCQPAAKGHNDTCCDTAPDNLVRNYVDSKPGAMMMGSNRLQRCLNYVSYLKHFYHNPTWPKYSFYHGAHDTQALLKSAGAMLRQPTADEQLDERKHQGGKGIR